MEPNESVLEGEELLEATPHLLAESSGDLLGAQRSALDQVSPDGPPRALGCRRDPGARPRGQMPLLLQDLSQARVAHLRLDLAHEPRFQADAVAATAFGARRLDQLEHSGGSVAMESTEHVAERRPAQAPWELHRLSA
jgi:hypothetical protein